MAIKREKAKARARTRDENAVFSLLLSFPLGLHFLLECAGR
jgi:hypothetical protein